MQYDESSVRELIRRYIGRECSLVEFRDTFVALTPGFEWDPDTSFGELLGSVELLFAESSNGDLDEDDLRQELRDLLSVGAATQ
jgi:hypothetical protein